MKKISKQATVVGIDLSDKKHQICALDKNGTIVSEKTFINTRRGLDKLSSEFPAALMAMEIGTHSPWISHHLEAKGHRVIVANARKLRAIYSNDRKSDRRDAQMIAKLARADEDLLYPIRHNSMGCIEDRQHLSVRDNLVKQRVSLINSVRFSLKSLGCQLRTTSSARFVSYVHEVAEISEHHLSLVAPLLRVIASISEEIKKLDSYITNELCDKYPIARRLMQIQGVGPITAVSFVLTIEDASRFENPRTVGAYLGLVPRRDQSGCVDKQLPISKAGNRGLRTLLVQCAQYIMRSNSIDSDLKRHGLRIANKGEKSAKRKAIVGVARKLSVVMLTLWQQERDYEPLKALKAKAC